MRFSLAKHLLELLSCVDADDQLVGVQHIVGVHAACKGGLDTGNVASALDELCIDGLVDQQVLLASANSVQHCNHSLGLVLVAGELINNDHVAIGSLVRQNAQQSQALDLVVDVVVVKENGLKNILDQLKENPRMVITDSQVFKKVSKDTPADVPLTSFSILMARYKGNLEQAVRGVTELERLKEGDVVLISEGCTHHRQCEDIGTVKIPRWIREYTGKEIQIETTSGTEFPDDLSKYKLIIHCGGCMLNEREMKYRYSCAADQGIPITNYGILIAYVNGILKRSVELFPELYEIL